VTKYVIVEGSVQPLGMIEARNARAAREAWAEKSGEEGEFYAVPARYWKALPVVLETRTVAKVADAKAGEA
jgi:hypothetical protein